MLSFRLMGFGEFQAKAQSLIKDNFEESSSSKGEHKLNVNWPLYQQFIDLNLLQIVGAFEGQDFVGYAIVIKTPDTWDMGKMSGMVQVMYLKPESRKGMAGVRLIKFAMNVAKAMECGEIKLYISRRSKSKRKKPISRLALGLGFTFKEAVFTKQL